MKSPYFTEMVIHGTAGSARDDEQAMLLLKEKDGNRIVPILTSRRRAMMLLARAHMPLPVPYPVSVADACHLLIRQYDIHLKRIEISHVKDAVFFCRILAMRDGEERLVNNCLATDGLIMAVTFGCPILIDNTLLDAQYMRPSGEDSYALNINSLSRSMLEDALAHAVDSENYEAASFLRDELRRRSDGDEMRIEKQ